MSGGYEVTIADEMKRKSTLVHKKEPSLSTLSEESESPLAKSARKRKPPNCSIITHSASVKKRLRNALPDIETLLLSSEGAENDFEASEDYLSPNQEEASLHSSQSSGSSILAVNSSTTLDLTQASAVNEAEYFLDNAVNYSAAVSDNTDQTFVSATGGVDNCGELDYVQLAVAEIDRVFAEQEQPNEVLETNAVESASYSTFSISDEIGAASPYVPLVDTDALIDMSTISSVDSAMLHCDATLPTTFPTSERVLSPHDDPLEGIVNAGDSVDLTTGQHQNRDEEQPRITYLLEPSERQRRKGTIGDQWARKSRSQKVVAASTINCDSSEQEPTKTVSQWSSSDVELLKANIENCATIYKCSPQEIIHNWQKGTRGDFYKIISTGLNRPLNSIYRKALRLYPKSRASNGKFTETEIDRLKVLHEKLGNNWVQIGIEMNRDSESVRNKFRCLRTATQNGGSWSDEETEKLKTAITSIYGENSVPCSKMDWNKISKAVKSRNAKQCRFKWLYGLYPKVVNSEKTSNWTIDDTLLILENLISSGANSEDEVDWDSLCSQLKFTRSPQWLRRFWSIGLKKTIGNGEKIEFKEALNKLQKFFHECNQLFHSGLDVCEEDLISNYTSSILDCHSLNEVILSSSIDDETHFESVMASFDQQSVEEIESNCLNKDTTHLELETK